MRDGYRRHERRWGSDTAAGGGGGGGGMSAGSSPGSSGRQPSEVGHGSQEFVEVTLDFQPDDTVVLRSVEPATAAAVQAAATADRGDSSEAITPASAASRSPSIRRSTSSNRLRQFSQELKAEAVAKAKQLSQELKKFSWSHGAKSTPLPTTSYGGGGASSSGYDSALAARALRRQRAQLDRTKSGAHRALRGLRFISKTKGVDAWIEVQRNFEKLSRDGYLSRSDFAQCIGMKDSKEFALEMFDALSRRRRMKMEKISKEELKEFWSQINDQGFDSRLQIFFDMVDKNEDGRITEAEVKEVCEQ